MIGNCQLEALGNLIIMNRNKFPFLSDVNITWTKPLFLLNEKNYVDLYKTLKESDFILHQYHSDKWNHFATSNLKKYFNLLLLPNLESEVSFPQLGVWKQYCYPVPELYAYIDFRFLQLYLENVPVSRAPFEYSNIELDNDRILSSVSDSAKKYKYLFENKKISVDYSNFYFKNLSENQDEFFTFNHPSNKHLEFLLNQIFRLIGVDSIASINASELLKSVFVPKLGTTQIDYFVRESIGLNNAAKRYYSYYDQFDLSFLINEFKLSNLSKFLNERC